MDLAYEEEGERTELIVPSKTCLVITLWRSTYTSSAICHKVHVVNTLALLVIPVPRARACEGRPDEGTSMAVKNEHAIAIMKKGIKNQHDMIPLGG